MEKKKRKRQDRINTYIEALNDLDTGERVTLKRAVGTRLAEAGPALEAFYSHLPYSVEPWEEGRWFAAACLACLWEPGDGAAVPLPTILKRLHREGAWNGYLKNRTAQLLDTRWNDEDGYLLIKLARFVKYLRQKGYRIDCADLLQDLLAWNSAGQYVQRKWAKEIFSTERKEK